MKLIVASSALTRRLPALVAGLALLSGCGSSGQSGAAAEAAKPSATATVEQLQPAAFAERIDTSDAMLINVHVPDEGEIAGTDAHIPYVSVAISDKLPADKNAELLIYCRSGRMSAEAGQSLLGAGYTHVTELAGGFEAWESAGRELVPAAT